MKSRAEVEDMARRHDETFGAGDFSPSNLVLIRHDDGTQLLFGFAFLRKHEDWAIVFTEHHGFHCFAIEDLDEFAQFVESPEIGTL